MNNIDSVRQLIKSLNTSCLLTKLESVNNFVNNNIEYVKDIHLWHVVDYWATPIETLEKGGGDCDDISILKYFILKELKLENKKLRLLFCNYLKSKEYHMVLMYDDFILDNINSNVLKLKERTDLVPVYSFNEYGFWIEKIDNRILLNKKLAVWEDLLGRTKAEVTQLVE